MPTFVDLLYQVKNKLPIRFGGTGNDQGAARNWLLLHYMNNTGGSIALGTLVKLVGIETDLRVGPTTAANDQNVLGVVVGRFTGDLDLFEAVAPGHQETVAVCIAGRCTVLVESAVTQGQFAYVSSTAGKAAGSSTQVVGTIGRFESSGSSTAKVVLAGGTAGTAGEDVYEDGVLQVDDFRILDFGAHLDVSAAGTTASVAVVTDDMTLDAEQVLVEDVGTYYTPDSPATGTETLRPTSDAAKSGSITYTSGSTGWNLVDESSLDTADNYYFGAFNCYIMHGFAATALTVMQRIDSIQIRSNTTNGAPAADGATQVRDPNTGTRYDVQGIGQNSGATAGEVLLTTRPWDSQPWELTDLQNIQIGVRGATGLAANLRVRQFYIEVNWTRRITVESALAELGAGGGGGDILSHTTSEMDADLVLAPDGAGGVEFRAEVGGSGGGGSAFVGAEAYSAATQTMTASTNYQKALEAEKYDTDGFHDNATNNSRMTIPAGLGGKYLVVATGAFALGNAPTSNALVVLDIYKNGSLYRRTKRSNFIASEVFTLTTTAVLDLAAGDYIEMNVWQNTGQNTPVFGSTADDMDAARLYIFKVGSGGVSGGIGARAHSTAGQSITSGSLQALTFGSEAFDTNGFHDTGSNTSRFTVPAGLGGKYLISGGCALTSSSATGTRVIALRLNGSTYIAANSTDPATTISEQYATISTVYDLAAGDYVEVMYRQDTGGSLSLATVAAYSSWGSVMLLTAGGGGGGTITVTEEDGTPSVVVDTIKFPNGSVTDLGGGDVMVRDVPQAFIGVAAYKSSDLAASAGTEVNLQMDAELFDTDGFHDNSTNNHRFTVPAGLGGKYLIILHARNDTNTDGYLVARKQTANVIVAMATAAKYAASSFQTLSDSAIVDLAAGDYVEFKWFSTGAGNLKTTAGHQAWAEMVKLDSGKVGSGIGARVMESTANQTIATDTPTAITFDEERFDTDGFHSTSVNTGRLTVPAGLGGIYVIGGKVYCSEAVGTTDYRDLYITLNGGATEVARERIAPESAGNTVQTVEGVYQLAAGDYVELKFDHSSGSDATIGNTSVPGEFWLARLDSGTSAYTGPRWGSGTAFPSGPATNDRFTRTDRGIDYFWDGTRWLSSTLYALHFNNYAEAPPSASAVLAGAGGWVDRYDVWMVDFLCAFYVPTTNNGSNYWTVSIYKGKNGGDTQLTSFSTASLGTSTYVQKTTAVNALVGTDGARFYLYGAKTASPGTLDAFATLTYRLVG